MLRHGKTVELQVNGHTRLVMVREITPLLAERLHAVILSGMEQGDAPITAKDVADLMVGDARGKLELLQECSDLGPEVQDLGGHAFMLLWRAFEEVNAPFLELLGQAMTQGLERAHRALDAARPDATQPDAAHLDPVYLDGPGP
jgi:hypothetical protein